MKRFQSMCRITFLAGEHALDQAEKGDFRCWVIGERVAIPADARYTDLAFDLTDDEAY